LEVNRSNRYETPVTHRRNTCIGVPTARIGLSRKLLMCVRRRNEKKHKNHGNTIFVLYLYSDADAAPSKTITGDDPGSRDGAHG